MINIRCTFAKQIANERGSTIVLGLILMVIVVTLSLSIAGWMVNAQRTQGLTIARDLADQVQETVVNAIENDSAFLLSINATGGALTCLTTNGANCAAGAAPQVLKLVNADGTPLTDLSSERGFDPYGKPCAGLKVAGNDACPIGFEVYYQIDAPQGFISRKLPEDTIARYPRVKIIGRFQIFAEQLENIRRLNPARFDFQFYRGSRQASLQSQCTSMGGTFIQDRGFCRLVADMNKAECPPFYSFDGVNTDGTLKCKPFGRYNSGSQQINTLLGTGCPPGTAITGFTPTGGLLCNGF